MRAESWAVWLGVHSADRSDDNLVAHSASLTAVQKGDAKAVHLAVHSVESLDAWKADC